MSKRVIILVNIGILTFVNMINTKFESKENQYLLAFQFYEQLKFHGQLSIKRFYNLGARFDMVLFLQYDKYWILT